MFWLFVLCLSHGFKCLIHVVICGFKVNVLGYVSLMCVCVSVCVFTDFFRVSLLALLFFS